MSKEYYQLGHIAGNRVLIEVEANENRDAQLSELWAYIQADGLPKYIAADPKHEAVLFEQTYPKLELDLSPEASTSVEGLGGDTGTLPSRDNKETIQ